MSSKSCNSFITNDLIQNIQNRFNKKTSRPPPSSSSTVRTYSLHDIKSRINYFENKLTDELHSLTTTTNLSNADKENSETTATITVKKRLKSLECKQTPETLQNVLVNTLANTCLKESYGNALSRTMNSIASSRNNHSLSTSRLNKMIMNRTRTLSYDGAYSGGGGGGGRKQLSNSLSELSALSKDDIERTSDTFVSNVDLENTYFYPYTEYDDGATSKLYDDSQQTTNDLYSGAVSLTTITSDHPSNSTLATSNSEKFCKQHQYKQSDENTCLEYSDGDFEQELLYQSDMDDISETTTTISAAAANNSTAVKQRKIRKNGEVPAQEQDNEAYDISIQFDILAKEYANSQSKEDVQHNPLALAIYLSTPSETTTTISASENDYQTTLNTKCTIDDNGLFINKITDSSPSVKICLNLSQVNAISHGKVSMCESENTDDLKTSADRELKTIGSVDRELKTVDSVDCDDKQSDFSGLVHATILEIMPENNLSDYDNMNTNDEISLSSSSPITKIIKQQSKSNNNENSTVRSNVDTMSITLNNHHRKINNILSNHSMNIQHLSTEDLQLRIIDHAKHFNENNDFISRIDHTTDEQDNSSEETNEMRYCSDAKINNSSSGINFESETTDNSSTKLRQQALCVTRVRCKRRKTWLRDNSPLTKTNFIDYCPYNPNYIPFEKEDFELSHEQQQQQQQSQNKKIKTTSSIFNSQQLSLENNTTTNNFLPLSSIDANNSELISDKSNKTSPVIDEITNLLSKFSSKSHKIANETVCSKRQYVPVNDQQLLSSSTKMIQRQNRASHEHDYGNENSITNHLNEDMQHSSTSTDNNHISPLYKDSSLPVNKDIDFQSSTSLLNDYYLLRHHLQQQRQQQRVNRSKSNSPPNDDILTTTTTTTTNKHNTHYSLNDSLDSNIEIMELSEQECIFEIVDGVLTIVPKEKTKNGTDMNHFNGKHDINMEHQMRIQEKNDDDDFKRIMDRSESVASSISTPSISEHEQSPPPSYAIENIENSVDKNNPEPFILSRNLMDTDTFSTPPATHKVTEFNNKTIKSESHGDNNLLNFDDSLSSCASSRSNSLSEEDDLLSSVNSLKNDQQPSSTTEKQTNKMKTSVDNHTSSPPTSLLIDLDDDQDDIDTIKKGDSFVLNENTNGSNIFSLEHTKQDINPIKTTESTTKKTSPDSSISSSSSLSSPLTAATKPQQPLSSSAKNTVVEHQTRNNKNNLLSELLQKRPEVQPVEVSIKTDELISPLSSSGDNHHQQQQQQQQQQITENTVEEKQYPLPKTEPPPPAKALSKTRINEFANLLSASVHLAKPPEPQVPVKKQQTPIIRPSSAKNTTSAIHSPPSPTRSEDQSFTSVPSLSSDREERDSYHTVKSNNSDNTTIESKPIDARYSEKIDDRTSITIKTANIKALFEQKLSLNDGTKSLSASNEQLLNNSSDSSNNLTPRQHKRVPISYGSLKKSMQTHRLTSIISRDQQNILPTHPPQLRRSSQNDLTHAMNNYGKYANRTPKDVVIEDIPPERSTDLNTSGNMNDTFRSNDSTSSSSTGSQAFEKFNIKPQTHSPSESLIAKEIRELNEKEEELKRQHKKCGLNYDQQENESTIQIVVDRPPTDPVLKREARGSTSFLSNLDFFTSKVASSTTSSPSSHRNSISNGSGNERRSSATTTATSATMPVDTTLIYDSSASSTPSRSSHQTDITNRLRDSSRDREDELKHISPVVTKELNRFNENGIGLVRTSSTNQILHRSSSNNTLPIIANVVQREIELNRLKEAELRELGRIIHTSDEHSDPRKYTEQITQQNGNIPKSHSVNTLVKIRRDSGFNNRSNNDTDFHNQTRTSPIIANTTNNGILKQKNAIAINSNDKNIVTQRKINLKNENTTKSSIERLEQEKREFREREQELRKQRNSTLNGDSGNVSQEEQEDEVKEGYFEKIERLKRSEHERTHAPLVRGPKKQTNLASQWEQKVANGRKDDSDDN